MRENRLYGSVGGWGLNRPPPTQSIARSAGQETHTTIARTAGQETHTTIRAIPR